MRQRLFITAILTLSAVVNLSAQALSDRYNKKRPVVVVTNSDHYIDVTKAVAEKLDVACRFVTKNNKEAKLDFEQGKADLLITDGNGFTAPGLFASKSIIDYRRVGADSLAIIRFVGKDRQLIDQIDDYYTRLKQDGDIAVIEKRWEHPELVGPQEETMVLTFADALLVISAILLVISLVLLWHIRATRRHTSEVSEMMTQTKQMSHYYAIEDNQAAHDLYHKYETILENPFLAIAFYDSKGRMIVENEAMKRMGHEQIAENRQPLYNAEGQVANYFVAIRPETTATT